MKSFVHYVLAFLFFGFIGEAHANNDQVWYYADPLPTMDPALPDTYDCLDAQCKFDSVDDYERVRITDGYETKIDQVRMYRSFICQDGYCYDMKTDAEIGVYTHDYEFGGGYPLGYYLISNHKQHLEYHRRGTGPYAERFPAFYVYGEEQNEVATPELEWEAPQGFAQNIDLWCDPMTDECRLNGELVLHHELPDHLEMANIRREEGSNHWCDGPVCYDGSDNFIGLNPFFYDL